MSAIPATWEGQLTVSALLQALMLTAEDMAARGEEAATPEDRAVCIGGLLALEQAARRAGAEGTRVYVSQQALRLAK